MGVGQGLGMSGGGWGGVVEELTMSARGEGRLGADGGVLGTTLEEGLRRLGGRERGERVRGRD